MPEVWRIKALCAGAQCTVSAGDNLRQSASFTYGKWRQDRSLRNSGVSHALMLRCNPATFAGRQEGA
jgi:hypothetical protein